MSEELDSPLGLAPHHRAARGYYRLAFAPHVERTEVVRRPDVNGRLASPDRPTAREALRHGSPSHAHGGAKPRLWRWRPTCLDRRMHGVECFVHRSRHDARFQRLTSRRTRPSHPISRGHLRGLTSSPPSSRLIDGMTSVVPD